MDVRRVISAIWTKQFGCFRFGGELPIRTHLSRITTVPATEAKREDAVAGSNRHLTLLRKMAGNDIRLNLASRVRPSLIGCCDERPFV